MIDAEFFRDIGTVEFLTRKKKTCRNWAPEAITTNL